MKAIALVLALVVGGCSCSDNWQQELGRPPPPPDNTVVFRPGDPAGSHDNVYTTWTAVYGAIQRSHGLGRMTLQFDDTFTTPVVIPPGQWEMNGGDVYWNSYNNKPTCTVEFADGAQIVVETPLNALPTWQPIMELHGTNLRLVSNRVGPVAPFKGVSLVLVGNRVRLLNTMVSAKPMFEVVGTNFIALAGNIALGGIGDSVPLPAPLIDLKGGTLIVAGGGGYISDNALTDSVGGGTVNIRVLSDTFGGGANAQNYDFPGLVKGGATLNIIPETRDRGKVFKVVATPTYAAAYNEIVFVNSTANKVTITAPKAKPASGERLVVKDIAGAAGHPIVVVPSDGDLVESGIVDPFEAKTWASDGQGNWWLVAASK